MGRCFRKLKTLSDWACLDEPQAVNIAVIEELPKLNILRLLLKPKYSKEMKLPYDLGCLRKQLEQLMDFDRMYTGIKDSWVYLTVRSGLADDTGDQWHFDGGSLRTELIPERNYVWCNNFGFHYKTGGVVFPDAFDPIKHNMFEYAEEKLSLRPVESTAEKQWYLLSPFVFHRRDPASTGLYRTFIRVSFVDIEVRDEKCTQNPMLRTEAYGRDPVVQFRDKLTMFKES